MHFSHYPAVVVKPGDELRMKCVYKTTTHLEYTFFGDGTQDEMCFGFITYYPAFWGSGRQGCMSFGGMLVFYNISKQNGKIYEKVT